MRINSFLTPRNLLIKLEANSKKQALEKMLERAAPLGDFEERAILDLLMERERLGCTGIGEGIAIPHTRCSIPEGRKAPIALLATLKTPVDFEANDEIPVDIIFMLLASDTSGGEHLTALALASRLLRNIEVATNLRAATSSDTAWQALTQNTKSKTHAA